MDRKSMREAEMRRIEAEEDDGEQGEEGTERKRKREVGEKWIGRQIEMEVAGKRRRI